MQTKCPLKQITIKQDREKENFDNNTYPWQKDPNGYFLVKINNDKIHCGFVNNNHKLTLELTATNPDKIIKEIVKRNLVEKPHLAYISSELMIALYCIQNKKHYTQR